MTSTQDWDQVAALINPILNSVYANNMQNIASSDQASALDQCFKRAKYDELHKTYLTVLGMKHKRAPSEWALLDLCNLLLAELEKNITA